MGILARGRLLREGPIDELCRTDGRWRVRFAAPAPAAALGAAGFTAESANGPATSGDTGTGGTGNDGGATSWSFAGEDHAALNVALDRARAAGALLVELRPEQRDLEEVLTRTIAEDSGA